MRRLGVSVMLTVLVAVLVAGCGGSSDTSQIKTTIKSFVDALGTGDAGTACADLDASEKATLVQAGASAGAKTCADVVKLLGRELTAAQKTKLKKANVTDVKITGSNATATVNGGATLAHLTKSGGHWLISGGITN
jgi:hypothetical protein